MALGSQHGGFLSTSRYFTAGVFLVVLMARHRSGASPRNKPGSSELPLLFSYYSFVHILSAVCSGGKAEEHWPLGYTDSLPLENKARSPGIQPRVYKCHSDLWPQPSPSSTSLPRAPAGLGAPATHNVTLLQTFLHPHHRETRISLAMHSSHWK